MFMLGIPMLIWKVRQHNEPGFAKPLHSRLNQVTSWPVRMNQTLNWSWTSPGRWSTANQVRRLLPVPSGSGALPISSISINLNTETSQTKNTKLNIGRGNNRVVVGSFLLTDNLFWLSFLRRNHLLLTTHFLPTGLSSTCIFCVD